MIYLKNKNTRKMVKKTNKHIIITTTDLYKNKN